MTVEGSHSWDDGAFYDSIAQLRVWQVGDRVRRVAGPPILLGSVGTVVAVGIPGRWPIKVAVDKKIGFGEVLCAADELAPEGESAPADEEGSATMKAQPDVSPSA